MADHRGVGAFFTHGLCKGVHDECAVLGVVEGFDVVHRVFLRRTFVCHNNDACIPCFLEGGLKCARINRSDADCVNALRNEVLADLRLHRGVSFRWALLEHVHACVGCVLLNAGLHTDEPRVGGVLRNDGDRVVAVTRSACCAGGCSITRTTGARCKCKC